MREILFRGRDCETGRWVYGDLAQFRDVDFINYYIKGIRCTAGVDRDTIGQFTGLCDKNGVKIFEGDIVMKRTYQGKKPFRVTFSSGCFHCGYGGGSSTATHPYTLDDNQIQVIGNIYDNPELLP